MPNNIVLLEIFQIRTNSMITIILLNVHSKLRNLERNNKLASLFIELKKHSIL